MLIKRKKGDMKYLAVLCLFTICISGCGGPSKIEEQNKNSMEVSVEEGTTIDAARKETQPETSEDEMLYDWIKTGDSSAVNQSSMSVQEGYQMQMYEMIAIRKFSVHFDDETIKSVTYSLSGGLGGFSENGDFAVNGQLNRDHYEMENLEYTAEDADLRNPPIFMYLRINGGLSEKDQMKETQRQVHEYRIFAHISYEDGSEQDKIYAFKFPYSYNYNTIDFYELSKK